MGAALELPFHPQPSPSVSYSKNLSSTPVWSWFFLTPCLSRIHVCPCSLVATHFWCNRVRAGTQDSTVAKRGHGTRACVPTHPHTHTHKQMACECVFAYGMCIFVRLCAGYHGDTLSSVLANKVLMLRRSVAPKRRKQLAHNSIIKKHWRKGALKERKKEKITKTGKRKLWH